MHKPFRLDYRRGIPPLEEVENMASNNPDRFKHKLETVVRAWQATAPTAKFTGMSVAEFEAKVKPSFDARQKIDEGERLV